MPIIFRTVWILILTWCLVAQLYAFAIPLALMYVFFYIGYELVIVAMVLDGYYFAFYQWPTISIGVFMLVLAADFIKPRLLMYTTDDALLP